MAEPINCRMVCTGKRLTKTGCDIVLSPLLRGTPGNGKPYTWMQLGSMIFSYPLREMYDTFVLGNMYTVQSEELFTDEELQKDMGPIGEGKIIDL